MLKLVIGNKNYSSWSLRAWLLLRQFELPFEEIRISLNEPDTEARLARYSPTLRVPVLIDGDLTVWDSLAIAEYVSERYLDGAGWPVDRVARALARSACAEMHAGFFELRERLPMNCRREIPMPLPEPVRPEVMRIEHLWHDLREHCESEGPWLCGRFGIVDCVFAPVVMRFRTYGVSVGESARKYMASMLALPALQAWITDATAEAEVIEGEEIQP